MRNQAYSEGLGFYHTINWQIFVIRELVTLSRFLVISAKGDNFCGFLFVSLHLKPLLFLFELYLSFKALSTLLSWSVNLLTVFLGRLILKAVYQYLCTYFHQQKGENDRRSDFMFNLHESYVA